MSKRALLTTAQKAARGPKREVVTFLSRVHTGLFFIKLTETVVNLTKLSPMWIAGKAKKLSSIDGRL